MIYLLTILSLNIFWVKMMCKNVLFNDCLFITSLNVHENISRCLAFKFQTFYDNGCHTVKTDRSKNNNENYSSLLLQGAIPDYRHTEVHGDSQNCRTFVVDVMKQVDSIKEHKRSSRNRKYSTQSTFPKDHVSACWTNLQFSSCKKSNLET